jgi:hypothetical protein
MSLIITLDGRRNEYDIQRQVSSINEGLKEIGILNYEFSPKSLSSDIILPWLKLSTSDLDYLKFVAAKLKEDSCWIPEMNFVNQKIPFDLKQEFIDENKSHLICHDNYSGIFVPVMFRGLSLPPKCLVDFGSSINLRDELKEIAGRLKLMLGDYNPDLGNLHRQRYEELQDDPIGFEKMLVLYLYNFCLASIKHGLIIGFSG